MNHRARPGQGDSDPVLARFKRPWKRRLATGVLLIVGGAALIVWIWKGGWVIAISLLPVALGIEEACAGIKGQYDERDGVSQWRAFRRDEARILDEVVGAIERKERPHDLLMQLGFSYGPVRYEIISRAKPLVTPSASEAREQTRQLQQDREIHDHLASFPPIRDFEDDRHELEAGDFERLHANAGITLSAQHQALLFRFNGGFPTPRGFRVPTTEGPLLRHVRAFFSVGTGGELGLEQAAQRCRESGDAAIRSMNPVARVREGGMLLESTSGKLAGKIFYLENAESRTSRLLVVSDDLFSFLTSLEWPPGEEPLQAPVSRRKRR